MTRKRNNPKKVGIGEYQFFPEEIELLGKIPDVSVAKIFRAPTWLIAQERTARGIPASSVRSKKQIKEVLQSLNAPRRYFKVLDLGGLSPRQKLHKERAEKKRKELAEKKQKYKPKPNEIRLMGKIPDHMVAKIAGATSNQIIFQREKRGIAAGNVRSHDKIREILLSLGMPKRYFSVLGISPKPPKQKKKVASKPKQMKPLREISVAALPHQRVRTSALPGQWSKGVKSSRESDNVPSSRKSDLDLLRDRTPVEPSTEYDINIDDFFAAESMSDRKRRLAVQDTMPSQGYPITRPLKNPRSAFASLDRVLGAQVDQFQEDLLHNPWTAYFKFLGFAVGATAFSLAAVKAISALAGKIN
jgi:hypothetical protein